MYSFKFALDIFNSEIQKLKLKIALFKDIKYILRKV